VRRVALTIVTALALLPLAAPALAAPERAELADVEDEVMCPICGTLLELAESPQALRQRALVKRLIAAGKTKDEIKDALVAQYGREVLALPGGSGFDLSAYLVPAIGFAAAAVALAIGVGRWRRNGGIQPPGPAPAEQSGEDAKRLETDLRRYDL
jgi:cytochrome c-type biogenesis protein CcmH